MPQVDDVIASFAVLAYQTLKILFNAQHFVKIVCRINMIQSYKSFIFNFLFTGGKIRGPYEDLRDSRLAFTVTTLLYVLFSVGCVIPVTEVLYVTYLLQIVARGFLHSVAVAAIPIL